MCWYPSKKGSVTIYLFFHGRIVYQKVRERKKDQWKLGELWIKTHLVLSNGKSREYVRHWFILLSTRGICVCIPCEVVFQYWDPGVLVWILPFIWHCHRIRSVLCFCRSPFCVHYVCGEFVFVKASTFHVLWKLGYQGDKEQTAHWSPARKKNSCYLKTISKISVNLFLFCVNMKRQVVAFSFSISRGKGEKDSKKVQSTRFEKQIRDL